MPKIDVEQFLAERKAEGLKIDPRTAEATWYYGYIVDPYGVCGDLPPEAGAHRAASEGGGVALRRAACVATLPAPPRSE